MHIFSNLQLNPAGRTDVVGGPHAARGPQVARDWFNIYIDDLTISLSNANAGCKFGGMSVNHFSYADDIAILSPSASRLQKLLNICASYAIKHEIIYNVKKTQCMVVPSTKFKLENTPSVFLNGAKLQYVDSYKQPGMFIHVRNDDLDIVRQLKSVILRTNILMRTFSSCSVEVTLFLFQSYCSNFTVLICGTILRRCRWTNCE